MGCTTSFTNSTHTHILNKNMGCSNSKSTNVVATPEKTTEKPSEPMEKPLLYWFRKSPPSSATHEIALMCLGADKFETKEVDLFQGEHKTEAYLKINAAGQVPALTHGDFQVAESRAIQQLIVRHSKMTKLLGGDKITCQAKVQQVMFYEAGTVNAKIGSIVGPVVFGGQELDEEAMKATLMPIFKAVDTMCAASKFIAGDMLTIVDINLVHDIGVFSLLGVEKVKMVFEHHKHICQWFKNVMACDEYRKCVETTAEKYPGG